MPTPPLRAATWGLSLKPVNLLWVPTVLHTPLSPAKHLLERFLTAFLWVSLPRPERELPGATGGVLLIFLTRHRQQVLGKRLPNKQIPHDKGVVIWPFFFWGKQMLLHPLIRTLQQPRAGNKLCYKKSLPVGFCGSMNRENHLGFLPRGGTWAWRPRVQGRV